MSEGSRRDKPGGGQTIAQIIAANMGGPGPSSAPFGASDEDGVGAMPKRKGKGKGKPGKGKAGKGKKPGATLKPRAKIARLEERLAKLRAKVGPPRSAFAPKRFPEMPQIDGVRLAAAAAGVAYSERDDVMLVEVAEGASLAGVFTRSATRSAPILWCEELIAARVRGDVGPGKIGIIVNAGNANAFTGASGVEAVKATAIAGATTLQTDPANIYIASTGVIGEPLPADRLTAKIGELSENLAPDAWEKAARAIMTTDAYPKAATAEAEIDGQVVKVAGFAKGAGMIAPNMATMLAFVFTDAAIAEPALQTLISNMTRRTFNAVTVDGDTSTSDTLLAAATGRAGNRPVTDIKDPRLANFRKALLKVMTRLSKLVVSDGEGASKLATIRVTGAASRADARKAARAIANSPLVKTALAGSDPNWGRIVMAVGKSGAAADRDRLSISFGDVRVAEGGWVAPGYEEQAGLAEFAKKKVKITVDLGMGEVSDTVWTCDLGHPYVACNADYRS